MKEMPSPSDRNLRSRRIGGLLKRWLHWRVWLGIYNQIDQKHTWQMAAALAYHFLFSLFPALILFSATVAFLPGHYLFGQALNSLAIFLPPDSMHLVRRVVEDVITPNRGAYVSLGFVGTIWAASSGLLACIEALNVAYDVRENRPFWKTRLVAVGLALWIGTLLLIAFFVMIVGPRFGQWLATKIHLSVVFVLLWPYIHWIIAIGFTVLGIETLYVLAPSGKRQYRATLPGATLAVGSWLGSSYLLGAYIRHFGAFTKTYGTLAGVIAMLIWLYWGGFAILLGAEINAQLAGTHPGMEGEEHETVASSKTRLAA